MAESTSAPKNSLVDPPELKEAIEALNRGDFERCLELAKPYADESKTRLSTDGHHLVALSLSRLDRYGEAALVWIEVYKSERTAANALQVATCLAAYRYLDGAKEWLEVSNEINRANREMSSALICSNFISALEKGGYVQEVFPYVQWLKKVYQSLQTTDSHFLFVRGVPLLHVFLERSLPITTASLAAPQVIEWYASMQAHLDEAGAATVAAFVAHLKEPHTRVH